MKKLLLNQIHIYTPTVIDVKSTLKIKQDTNDDFDIDNFLYYPFLINNDGSLWKHGNLYLLHKLNVYLDKEYCFSPYNSKTFFPSSILFPQNTFIFAVFFSCLISYFFNFINTKFNRFYCYYINCT